MTCISACILLYSGQTKVCDRFLNLSNTMTLPMLATNPLSGCATSVVV